jgi:hypothetical protein
MFRILILLIVQHSICFGQGLEGIVVEKYYISDKNDAGNDGGNLPPGSVTYRIFADMKPGYRFQAVFGIPGHPMRIETTTSFFNNEFKGSYIPTIIPMRFLDHNTVMLDSWLSAGAAGEENWGVLKSEDDTAGTIRNRHNLLKSTDPKAGIPLAQRDGLYTGITPRITFFGIDSLAKAMFGNANTAIAPQVFESENGSWSTLEGSNGPTAENRVLIAQMTTDGKFSFELNIQIGKPGEGFEQYVARNPSADQLTHPSLIYRSGKGRK